MGISREKLATKVLPHLIPLSIESSLNLKQYSAYASLIHDMCKHLEREQFSKLEQLHGATDENSMLRIGNLDESMWNSSNSCSDLFGSLLTFLLSANLEEDNDSLFSKNMTTLTNSLAVDALPY
ncbi:unnamed protein product [Trichobilharzia regenti]|nr:unnamed protein product [Trichobilharzia regenti]